MKRRGREAQSYDGAMCFLCSCYRFRLGWLDQIAPRVARKLLFESRGIFGPVVVGGGKSVFMRLRESSMQAQPLLELARFQWP